MANRNLATKKPEAAKGKQHPGPHPTPARKKIQVWHQPKEHLPNMRSSWAKWPNTHDPVSRWNTKNLAQEDHPNKDTWKQLSNATLCCQHVKSHGKLEGSTALKKVEQNVQMC